jgi:hypothetical protein
MRDLLVLPQVDTLATKLNAFKRTQIETAAELDAPLPSILDKALRGEV